MWDLYNEPGNEGLLGNALPLLREVVGWAREVEPSQPLTVGELESGRAIRRAQPLPGAPTRTS